MAFARKAEVERLVLFHHDPGHTDEEMEALLDEARRLWGDDGAARVCCAWDGMTIDLDQADVRLEPAPAAGAADR